jgi:hypothetical protein
VLERIGERLLQDAQDGERIARGHAGDLGQAGNRPVQLDPEPLQLRNETLAEIRQRQRQFAVAEIEGIDDEAEIAFRQRNTDARPRCVSFLDSTIGVSAPQGAGSFA